MHQLSIYSTMLVISLGINFSAVAMEKKKPEEKPWKEPKREGLTLIELIKRKKRLAAEKGLEKEWPEAEKALEEKAQKSELNWAEQILQNFLEHKKKLAAEKGLEKEWPEAKKAPKKEWPEAKKALEEKAQKSKLNWAEQILQHYLEEPNPKNN